MGLLLLFAVLTSRRGPATLGPRLTLAQLRDVAKRAGFPDPDLAAAVAMAESGGDPQATGDGGKSLGLWQIHTPSHPEWSPANLFVPLYNALAAFAISNHGADWSPWSTFRSSAYLQFLRRVQG